MHWPSSSRAGVFARVWAFTGLLLVAAATPAMGQQPEGVKVLIGFARQPGPAEEALVRAAGGRIKYSYGSSLNPGGTVEAAFDNSAAAGVLHVAAAGNSGNPKARGIMWVGPPGTTRL